MPAAPSSLGHDPWQLVESAPDATQAALREALFALGNGRIGIRGAHEEGAAWPGTEEDAICLNGFFETEEDSPHQFVVALPNGKAIRWSIDGEPFDPTLGRIVDFRRSVDFRSGQLTREFVWVSPGGRRVAVHSRRLVCLAREHVYAMAFELRPLDRAARIVIESSLDARAAHALERIGLAHANGRITQLHRTRHSGLQLASAIEHALQTAVSAQSEACGGADDPGERFLMTLPVNEPARLTKYCALVSSRDAPEPGLIARAGEALAHARATGFDGLCAEQLEFLARYWDDADVQLDGDDALQQALRFNLLHLLQSAGRDGRSSIAAQGLTGCRGGGHYLWDAEIHAFPVLLHTQPDTARKLLEYRHHTLPAARARAREHGCASGALFAWRTISGPECRDEPPGGAAQLHINADIAFAVRRYWGVTGDDEFMLTHGAELVFETARVWLALGRYEYHPQGERFGLHAVSGPDAGADAALADNHLYTNAMALMHLRFAAEIAQWLAGAHPGSLEQLALKIALDRAEPAQWLHAAAAMFLPYDPVRRIHPQDDRGIPDPAPQPQVDVLLALLLLDEQFDPDDKRRDFDHYEPLTTHETTRSHSVLGIVASEVGEHRKAYEHFAAGARLDLDDVHGSTRHGVHTAAMAGSWLGVVAGFAGLRMRRGVPVFAPRLPDAWARCTFKLHVGAAQLRVELDARRCHYELLRGSALALRHRGADLLLTTAHPSASFPAIR